MWTRNRVNWIEIGQERFCFRVRTIMAFVDRFKREIFTVEIDVFADWIFQNGVRKMEIYTLDSEIGFRKVINTFSIEN